MSWSNEARLLRTVRPTSRDGDHCEREWPSPGTLFPRPRSGSSQVRFMAPSLLVVQQLDGWAEQWDRLVDAAPLPSPFLRSWWLTGTGGPQSLFVLVVDGTHLIGGLPLEESHGLGLRRLRMMSSGSLCPDHMDLVSDPHEIATTVAALRTWLTQSGATLLDLKGVPADARLMSLLPHPVSRQEFALAPWTPLPEDSQTYLAQLPSQFRRQVRRAHARLSAEGIVYRTHRGPSAVIALDTLRMLHHAQWGNRSQFLSQFDRFASAFRLGVGAGEVTVHELGCDTFVAATVISFEVAGRLSLYQSARLTEPHWREAMSVLLTGIITDACHHSLSEVDFLRGDEPYKYRYAPKVRHLFRLLAGTRVRGRAAWKAKAASFTMRQMAERTVRAGRIALTQSNAP